MIIIIESREMDTMTCRVVGQYKKPCHHNLRKDRKINRINLEKSCECKEIY